MATYYDDEGNPIEKDCPDCKERHPIENFYKIRSKTYRGGYRYSAYCKKHTYQRTLKSKLEAPEGSKLREAMRRGQRKYMKNHPDKARAQRQAYYDRHPERTAERYSNWVENNRERRRASQRAWYERKKERDRLAKAAAEQPEESL